MVGCRLILLPPFYPCPLKMNHFQIPYHHGLSPLYLTEHPSIPHLDLPSCIPPRISRCVSSQPRPSISYPTPASLLYPHPTLVPSLYPTRHPSSIPPQLSSLNLPMSPLSPQPPSLHLPRPPWNPHHPHTPAGGSQFQKSSSPCLTACTSQRPSPSRSGRW